MLSDRIRPDIEAAPWVCQEVRQLEARLADAATLIRRYCEAATKGVIMSSAKDGTWNVEQDMRAWLLKEWAEQRTADSASEQETVK